MTRPLHEIAHEKWPDASRIIISQQLCRRVEVHSASMPSGGFGTWMRDQEAERAVEAWEAIRDWIDSYGLTEKEIAAWTEDPLHIDRLTEQCQESLGKHLIAALRIIEKEAARDRQT